MMGDPLGNFDPGHMVVDTRESRGGVHWDSSGTNILCPMPWLIRGSLVLRLLPSSLAVNFFYHSSFLKNANTIFSLEFLGTIIWYNRTPLSFGVFTIAFSRYRKTKTSGLQFVLFYSAYTFLESRFAHIYLQCSHLALNIILTLWRHAH